MFPSAEDVRRAAKVALIVRAARKSNPMPGRQVISREGEHEYGLPIGATIAPGTRKLTELQREQFQALSPEQRGRYFEARRTGTHAAALKAVKPAPVKKATPRSPAKAGEKAAPAKRAPTKAVAARSTAGIPTYEPPASLTREEIDRATRLIRRAGATVNAYNLMHDARSLDEPPDTYHGQRVRDIFRYSGTLSDEDAAWLFSVFRREPTFVARLAQTQEIQRNIRDAAKKAGKTPAQYRRDVAAQLKAWLADRPVAVRVRDESALRSILSGGRFKTQHEGARRAPGLQSDTSRRSFGEQVSGVDPATPPERRPVYGYVAVNGVEPALSAGRKLAGVREREGQEDVLSSYGTVQVVLKPEVRTRTTVAVGDSLDEIGLLRPSPIDNPTAESTFRQIDANFGPLTDPRWSRRAYVEAQVHGGVRVGDIDEVVFADEPEPATASALNAAGVPWRVLRPGGQTGRPEDKLSAYERALTQYGLPSRDASAYAAYVQRHPGATVEQWQAQRRAA